MGALVVMLLVGAAPAAADTTITVNTTMSSSPSGDGLCSLAEAVSWANGSGAPDCAAGSPSGTTTINLPAGDYVVSQTLALGAGIRILGAGASSTTIDGGGSVEVLEVGSSAHVTVSGLTISGGNSTLPPTCPFGCTSSPGNFGGGIYNAGTLALDNVTVSGNRAGNGFTGFSILCFTSGCNGDAGGAGGDGGGIYSTGTLTIADSTISGNSAGAGSDGGPGYTNSGGGAGKAGGNGGLGGAGGGIYNAGGTLTISDSTIAGNAAGAAGSGGNGSKATQSGTTGGDAGSGGAGGSGGGIASEGGSVTIVGSTFVGNNAGAGATAGSPGSGDGAAGGAAEPVGDGGPIGALDFNGSGGFTAALANDTFTGNSTGPDTTPGNSNTGGVVGALGIDGTATLTNLTIAGNTASSIGGGVYVIPGSAVTVRNSIIAGNSSSDSNNCDGIAMGDGGHNITYGNAVAPACPGLVADPKLQPLAANGGPTQTMRLGAGSAAIDAVPVNACSVTTDQRGIARPQGAACDAGAYEVAPPKLASLAVAANGTSSVTVSGQVTPNMNDTKVSVSYGTSASYGSTSATTDMGAGSTAAALTQSISGLQPATTYHFQVVATNLDGTTTSSDLTVTTATPAAPAPTPKAAILTVSVPASAIKGDVIPVTLSCASGGGACAGGLVLSSRVTRVGGKVVAVSASAGKSKRPKRRTVVVTVGGGSYTLAAGQTQIVKLTLNGVGKRLLKARRRLPTLLTTSGAAQITKHVTFLYKRPGHKKKR